MIKGTAVLESTYKLALVPKFSSVRTESSARLQQGTPTATSTAASRPLRRLGRALPCGSEAYRAERAYRDHSVASGRARPCGSSAYRALRAYPDHSVVPAAPYARPRPLRRLWPRPSVRQLSVPRPARVPRPFRRLWPRPSVRQLSVPRPLRRSCVPRPTRVPRPLRRSCRALRVSATTPSPLAVPVRAAAQRTAPYARTATTPSPLMRPTRVRDHSVASCRTSACGISACRTAFASTSMRAPRAAPTPVRPEHPPGSPQHRPRAHGKQIPCAAHDYCAMDRAQRQSAE